MGWKSWTKLSYHYSLTTNGKFYINKVTKSKRKATTKKRRNLLLITVGRRLLPQEGIWTQLLHSLSLQQLDYFHKDWRLWLYKHRQKETHDTFKAITMKMAVFLYETPRFLAEIYWSCSGTQCFHLSRTHTWIVRAVRTSETSIIFHQTHRPHAFKHLSCLASCIKRICLQQ